MFDSHPALYVCREIIHTFICMFVLFMYDSLFFFSSLYKCVCAPTSVCAYDLVWANTRVSRASLKSCVSAYGRVADHLHHLWVGLSFLNGMSRYINKKRGEIQGTNAFLWLQYIFCLSSITSRNLHNVSKSLCLAEHFPVMNECIIGVS